MIPVVNEVNVIPWAEDNACKVMSIECFSIDRMQESKEEHAPNARVANAIRPIHDDPAHRV